ncbi:hypothetical protein CFVI97532_06975 [Campylobacter fetus subsp. venerealis cfvi97/532]|nr:hypothetical protein CFVI97532_06975 [Campylobacter fetus subsp. venerealis cfvi97/532]
MNEIEKIANLFSEFDSRDFAKALILYEKEYLFDNVDLTKEQKEKALEAMYEAVMKNNQGSLLGDEHSEAIEDALNEFLEENLTNQKRNKKR